MKLHCIEIYHYHRFICRSNIPFDYYNNDENSLWSEGVPPHYVLDDEHIGGEFDIDSIFICSRSILFFEAPTRMSIFNNITYHKTVQNEKAIAALNEWVHKRRIYSEDVYWTEIQLSPTNDIHVLFAVSRENGRVNCGKVFSSKVLKPLLENFPKTTETSMWHAKDVTATSNHVSHVFMKDYDDFAKHLDQLTSRMVQESNSIIDVLFYRCKHGLR